MQLIFVIYQYLPKSIKFIEQRNDDLIFGGIKYKFVALNILQVFWLLSFGLDHTWSFIVSLILIIFMLINSLMIMHCVNYFQIKNSIGIINLRI